ncbi:dipeptidase [Gracilibacillus kekensis]|uniref:Membrane dipeptidase n=1 Tax=Gracilibacillus kekensis TaxID=1027249 RepID=A0A1M7PJ61_9BACI|nr:membrane dipeptidase [Gracilibacillus kekensis]SHN17100.1 membrane dipeptidase [Gracilibacillus kekensis]
MIIDCHCDALLKMWLHKVDFIDDVVLDVNRQKWINSPVRVQCFAIYVPEHIPTESKFIIALEMIDLFIEKIIKPYSDIKWIKQKLDIEELKSYEKGAMLTLEGLDCIGNDLFKLRLLIRLGVKMIGMSWNTANLAVDGIGESRAAGLTDFGKKVIQLANQEKVWIDLAHISTQGFNDAIELANHVIVSHANSRKICDHARNLDDEQIKKIIEKNGLIGITFVKDFVVKKEKATIADLIYHIAHFIQMGAEDHIVFGSDFDGTDQFIEHLSAIDNYWSLQLTLHQRFSLKQCQKISYLNFLRHFPS